MDEVRPAKKVSLPGRRRWRARGEGLNKGGHELGKKNSLRAGKGSEFSSSTRKEGRGRVRRKEEVHEGVPTEKKEHDLPG